MIFIAGGTGHLGPRIIRLLTARGLAVRVLTRNPEHANHLGGDLVEIVSGDVRHFDDLTRAMTGARTVISAISGFGIPGVSPRTVDWEGNRNLIRAAQACEVEHFILVSILGAAPNHPIGLYRMKYLAEQELKASQLAWTIIRPSTLMEPLVSLIGEPLLKTGKTRLFGRGNNPINFVSTQDVARFVELSVIDPAMHMVLVEVGGPDNLSLKRVVEIFEKVTGKVGAKSSVPLPMLRLMSVLTRLSNPTLARLIQAAIIMDTKDMSFDPTETRHRYPSIPLTNLAELVRREYVDVT